MWWCLLWALKPYPAVLLFPTRLSYHNIVPAHLCSNQSAYISNFIGADWTDLCGRERDNGNCVTDQSYEFHGVSLLFLMHHDNRTNSEAPCYSSIRTKVACPVLPFSFAYAIPRAQSSPARSRAGAPVSRSGRSDGRPPARHGESAPPGTSDS